jgi:dTMP kinase
VRSGRYVVLDGPDGCGKSTQALSLCGWLDAEGASVLHLREPGSTPVGEALRQLLLDPTSGELRSITEALLFMAARAELVEQVIRPALQQGKVVVAERCYVSTLCYQGLAGEPPLDLELLFDLARRVHGDCLPQRVYVLDLPASAAAARRSARARDRFEARDAEFHERVRQGFRRLAGLDAAVELVDAMRSFDAVQDDLRQRLAQVLR